MSTEDEFHTRGADAFIDHCMPVIRKVWIETRDADAILLTYSGIVGAVYGSMVADMGRDYAMKALQIMVRKFEKFDPSETMQ